jgi:hypothetical protein
MEGLVAVRFHAVPSDERHHVEKLLLRSGLDSRYRWIAAAGTADNSWGGADYYFQLIQHEEGLAEETDL